MFRAAFIAKQDCTSQLVRLTTLVDDKQYRISRVSAFAASFSASQRSTLTLPCADHCFWQLC